MGDLWNCTFNQSTVVTANVSIYERLKPVEKQIKSAILAILHQFAP